MCNWPLTFTKCYGCENLSLNELESKAAVLILFSAEYSAFILTGSLGKVALLKAFSQKAAW